MRVFPVALLVVISQWAIASCAEAAIVLNDGGVTNLNAVVRDRDVQFPDNTINTLNPAALPFIGNHSATVGGSTNQVSYDLSQASFQISNVGTRAGSLDSRSNASGNIFFSVSDNMLYSLAAQFATVDPSAKFVNLTVTLTDLTTSTVLFHNEQASFGVVDESFVLGQTGGNQTNALSGSLTGTLLAGHQFRLEYLNTMYASNAGSPATGTGSFSLQFAAVPEPSSMLFLGLASTVAYFCYRRRTTGTTGNTTP